MIINKLANIGACSIIITCLLTQNAEAKVVRKNIPENWSLSMGIGFVVLEDEVSDALPTVKISDTYTLTTLPIVNLQYKDYYHLTTESTTFGKTIVNRDDLFAKAGLSFHHFGREESLDHGRREVPPVTDLSIGISKKMDDKFSLDLLARKAISGGHTGSRVFTSINYSDDNPFLRSSFLDLSLIMAWHDKKYASAFDDVSKKMASKSEFEEFNSTKGYASAGIQIDSIKYLGKRWEIIARLTHTERLGSVESPIVDGNGETEVFLLFNYNFM